MKKGAATRETIIDEALRQALHRGLEGISLGMLADSLNLSKSGLFAHFKSKEALQIAILQEATERFRRLVVLPALARPRGRDRLKTLFRLYLDWMGDGCLFSAVAQEIEELPDAVAAAFIDSQIEWRATIARVVSDALGSGKDAAELVIEFIGLALAYQQAVKVFHDESVRQQLLNVFERRLEVSV